MDPGRCGGLCLPPCPGGGEVFRFLGQLYPGRAVLSFHLMLLPCPGRSRLGFCFAALFLLVGPGPHEVLSGSSCESEASAVHWNSEGFCNRN